nr:flagellar biosynthesis protein FlgE [Candidatus Krumholzibacteria bacterium]
MISTAMNHALQGIQANQNLFQTSAQGISRALTPGAEGGDLIDHEVGLLRSRRGLEANLNVVKTADEMLGSLIDTLA